MNLKDKSAALHALLQALRVRAYHFITPTPLTHARVIARADKQAAKSLRDVFGWSLPFKQDIIDPDLFALMAAAEIIEPCGDQLKSTLRVSSLDNLLFLHSAFPTTEQDSVFFGPDSYRFAAFVQKELPRYGPISHLADIGSGSGVGAVAALQATDVSRLTLTDVNQAALELAHVNILNAEQTLAAEITLGAALVNTNALDGIGGPIQAIIANPPYIIDTAHRAYRDGGALHGAEVSLNWAKAAADKLGRGGIVLLYTGSAIIDGEDLFKGALYEALGGFDISYRELDPDVFGEELARADYADVERIAVVGVVAVKR